MFLLTFHPFLCCSTDQAAKRGAYGEERYEKIDFQHKVRECFMGLKAADEEQALVPWFTLNAARSIETVAADIRSIVDKVIVDSAEKEIGKLWPRD